MTFRLLSILALLVACFTAAAQGEEVFPEAAKAYRLIDLIYSDQQFTLQDQEYVLGDDPGHTARITSFDKYKNKQAPVLEFLRDNREMLFGAKRRENLHVLNSTQMLKDERSMRETRFVLVMARPSSKGPDTHHRVVEIGWTPDDSTGKARGATLFFYGTTPALSLFQDLSPEMFLLSKDASSGTNPSMQ